MEMDLEKIESERIERFLKLRLGDQAWSVDEAKAKLTKIMKEAKGGKPQLVGLRKPVVMIGMEKLEELVTGLQQPETWGEYFATAHDGRDDNDDIPMRRYGGRASYSLDIGEEHKAASVSANDEIDDAIQDDLELIADYMSIGDDEAAQIVLDDARECMGFKKVPTTVRGELVRKIQKGHVAKIRKRGGKGLYCSFLKKHSKGCSVDGEIVEIGPRRVFLKIQNGVMGVAYTKEAGQGGFVAGNKIRVQIVSSKPTRQGVAVSLVERTNGTLIGDMEVPVPNAAEK